MNERLAFFGIFLLHGLPDLVAECLDGLFGGKGLQNDDQGGNVVASHHCAFLEGSNLTDLFNCLEKEIESFLVQISHVKAL